MPISTIRQVATNEKIVTLTFNDGPNSDYTLQLVDTLRNYNSNATWFILGAQAKGRTALLRDIHRAGNDIGARSYDNMRLTGLSQGQVMNQLGRTRELIEDAAGRFWGYFRPPYGAFNQSVLSAASGLDYRWNVLWSADPKDDSASGNQILTRVLSALQPGAIILLHESARVLQSLPLILQNIRDRGYRAVTLTTLLKSQPIGPTQCRILAVVTPYLQGDDVTAVQAALMANGFNPGPIDGIFGPRTSAAVASFQAAKGLPATGNVDYQTYAALGIECPQTPPPCRTLKLTSPYMRGEDIRTVQTILSARGFDPGPVDGIYGPRTSAAVSEFQTAQGLPATGIVDIATYSALGITCP
ncbi:MAG: peptidoglycan-binding protein [Deltaproteobacteria bacterium]